MIERRCLSSRVRRWLFAECRQQKIARAFVVLIVAWCLIEVLLSALAG